MRRVSLAVVVSFLWLQLSTSASRADLVEFTFNGSVTSVFDLGSVPSTHPLQSAAFGDSLTLTYVFESSTADTNGALNIGSYVGAIQSASVSVGSNLFEYDSLIDRLITVVNDSSGPPDLHQSDMFGSDANGNSLQTFLRLQDSTALVFGTDALPVTMDVSDFNIQSGFLELPSGCSSGFCGATAVAVGPEIRFRVDSLTVSVVPLPGAALLGLVGLALAPVLKRRLS